MKLVLERSYESRLTQNLQNQNYEIFIKIKEIIFLEQ